MKKSTRKIINNLSKYIGLEIIRTKPTLEGDWSYTGEHILLVGFTLDGRIRYRVSDEEALWFGNKEFILPLSFTDGNWITYNKALRAKHNELNKWRGKKIKRVCSTSTCGDCSYMSTFSQSKAPTLISASKHHIVIMCNQICLEGEKRILGPDFANPEDWVLAE